MNRILFVSIGSHIPEARFYEQIAMPIQCDSNKCSIITLSLQETHDLRESEISTHWFGKYLERHSELSPTIVAKESARLLKDYHIPSLRWLWQSDRAVSFYDSEQMHKKTVQYFLAWEEAFREFSPSHIITDFGGELFRRVPKLLAEKYNAKYYYLDWSPIRGKFALHQSEMNHWQHMEVKPTPLPADAQHEVDTYLETVHSQRISAVRFWTPEVSGQRMKRLIRELWREYHTEKGLHDHFTPTQWFKEYVKRVTKKPFISPLYSKPTEGESYIFLPLHVPDDAQLTVRAPAFSRQDFLVDLIARSLPEGKKLYVKEHPHFIAKYPMSVYRSIASTNSVRLIPPYIHPHEVIRSAEAVVTVNSTAGFESLLFHKPLVVLGSASYRGYGATVDVDDLKELPAKISEALERPPETWKIDRLIWSVMNASHDGKLYDFGADNIHKISESIKRAVCGPTPA